MNKYIKTLLDPIRVCASYTPKFGTGRGISLQSFLELYGNDPFYSAMGLNTPLLYGIHKAAGGITSLYRQIGTGCERLIRQILVDSLNVPQDMVTWSYPYGKKGQMRHLDGRIEFSSVPNDENRARVRAWAIEAAETIGVDPTIASHLKGIVFEIRQGYKSKDAKRQNADIVNASTAYSQAYLPCLMLISSQIDEGIFMRYKTAKWMILQGVVDESPLVSTYSFLEQIVGFDLLSLLKENKDTIQNEIKSILSTMAHSST